MRKIMVDLETVSTRSNAAIVAVGAVVFDRNNIYDHYYRTVDLTSSIESGGHVCGDTIQWWLAQSDEARHALSVNNVPLRQVLEEFAVFAGDPQFVEIWGNGASFDNVILGSAYGRMGIELPWRFYNNRCFRTLKSVIPVIPPNREGVHHNALDDALYQVEWYQRIMEGLPADET